MLFVSFQIKLRAERIFCLFNEVILRGDYTKAPQFRWDIEGELS